jgi:TolA-binding protein
MMSRAREQAGARALLLAVLLSGSACAYYNTFHSARTSFRNAETQYEASGQEHAAPGVLDLYSKAIERSQKVLTKYPRSKWVDDARLLIGMAYLRREEYEKGMSAFAELIEKEPESKLVPDATFGIGLCQLGRGDWEEAEQTFGRLLAENPKYKKRGEVMYRLAENAAKRRDYRMAVAGYTGLLAGEETKGFDLARVHHARGEAYLALEVPDSALADFTAAVDLSNVPEKRFESKLMAGESLEKLGRNEEALALYAQLEREMPGPKELPRTLLRQGRVDNALGRHPEALAVYARVIKEFPASSFAAEAQYQTAFTQEVYLEDLDQAKESYGKVRELAPGSEFTALAEERKQSIDLYGKYRTEMAEGGEEEKKATAALMLAEVSLFRLRKVDEAIAAYEAVERDYPNSTVAPKAAYAVAWIQEHEKGDSLAAVAGYERVFDHYPDTEFGVDAGVRVGRLSADSLSIYRGRVLRLRAVADSLSDASRARAAAARADSLAAAGGSDSLAAAVLPDSLAAAVFPDSLATVAGDSLAAALPDSLAVAGSDTLGPEAPPRPAPPGVLTPPGSTRPDGLTPEARAPVPMPPGGVPPVTAPPDTARSSISPPE